MRIGQGLLLILLALLLHGCGAGQCCPHPSRFIGTIHPPVPEGVEILGEVLAIAPGEEAEQAQYAFSHIREGKDHLLWLSRLLERNDLGEPTWTVVDATEPLCLHGDESVMLADCRYGGRTDIVALVVDGDSMHPEVRRAWGVDRRRERFVDIAPSEVQCRKIFLSGE